TTRVRIAGGLFVQPLVGRFALAGTRPDVARALVARLDCRLVYWCRVTCACDRDCGGSGWTSLHCLAANNALAGGPDSGAVRAAFHFCGTRGRGFVSRLPAADANARGPGVVA